VGHAAPRSSAPEARTRRGFGIGKRLPDGSARLLSPTRTATIDEETRHLLEFYREDGPAIMAELGSQLTILASRAQTLLSLAGITITVTGFSGASIARTGKVAAALLVSGLVIVLIAAALSITGILQVRWTTQIPPCSLEDAIKSALEVRDAKTRNFSRSLTLLVFGLSLYVASIALMLLANLF
jgi:hypothetical protein